MSKYYKWYNNYYSSVDKVTVFTNYRISQTANITKTNTKNRLTNNKHIHTQMTTNIYTFLHNIAKR